MNNEELREYRAGFSGDILFVIAMVYMFELHGLAIFLDDGEQALLTDDSRQLAGVLLDEEAYQDYALKRVNRVLEDSSHVNLLQ